MKYYLITLGLACLTATAAFAETQTPTKQNAVTNDNTWKKPDEIVAKLLKQEPDLTKGEEAYKGCRGCHKADGSGKADKGYPQLAGQHVSVLIKQMVDVRAGHRENSKMHPFIEEEEVSREDLANIAAYLHSLPVPETLKGDGTMLEHGEKLFKRDCTECHGDKGEGNAKKFFPNLAIQHYLYLYQETQAIRDHQRGNANTHTIKILQPYSDADLAAVSDYISRLSSTAK